MKYQHGQKRTYVSTRTFTMGNDGVTIPEGQDIEFDGTFVSYAGMPPVMMPQLRGAIRAGWLVSPEEYDPNAPARRPPSAGMTLRPADGGNPMDKKPRREVSMDVESEEREVANVRDHAAATRNRNVDNYRRADASRASSTAGQRYEGLSVESQEGVEVPGIRFQTPAGEKAKRASTDLSRAGEAISAANKVKINPGRGRSRDELIRDAIASGRMTEEDLEQYEQDLEALRMRHGVELAPSSTVVGRVATTIKQHKEGFDITNSVGGGTEIADLGGTGGTGEESVVEAEGIKFTNTNGPKKSTRMVKKAPETQEKPVSDEVCRKIARAICADFPDNYVFTDSTRKKLARLQADYEDRPDVIRAVAAAETDGEVKRRLIEEFPEAFDR